MPLILPPGKRMAVALTFDFDAHSNWMGSLGRPSLPTCPAATSAPRRASRALLGLEQLLDEMAGHSGIWYATLSELADAWHD